MTMIIDLNEKISEQKLRIANETEKAKLGEVINQQSIDRSSPPPPLFQRENALRTHDYIPFIVELLRQTAMKGKLNVLIEKAKAK